MHKRRRILYSSSSSKSVEVVIILIILYDEDIHIYNKDKDVKISYRCKMKEIREYADQSIFLKSSHL